MGLTKQSAILASTQRSHPSNFCEVNPLSTKVQHIAVIDDDPLVRTAIASLLNEHGYEPHTFANREALLNHRGEKFDLYLIDLRLVNESGLDIAREIHQTDQTPVIMLSGVGDEIDKAIGLEAGADDFVSKPFNARELIARIRALLRRNQITKSKSNSAVDSDNAIHFGRFTVNFAHRQLIDDQDREIPLTNAEFRLLEYLITHHDRIIDRTELLTHLGGDLSQYVDRTIDVMILRLRGKIEASPSRPLHIQTRRGKGYVFVLSPNSNRQ